MECMLQHTVGHAERCPHDACPFWLNDGCGLESIRADIETNPELAGFLLDVRAAAAETRGWRPFRRVSRPSFAPAER
jgi:hypothetical protein